MRPARTMDLGDVAADPTERGEFATVRLPGTEISSFISGGVYGFVAGFVGSPETLVDEVARAPALLKAGVGAMFLIPAAYGIRSAQQYRAASAEGKLEAQSEWGKVARWGAAGLATGYAAGRGAREYLLK